MTNEEKAKREELAREFGSSGEVKEQFTQAARLDKQIQSFENQIEALQNDFNTYQELLNRIQEGELQPGRGGKYKAPNDLRKAGASSAAGIAFRGTEQQVKAQLERLQAKLDNIGKLFKSLRRRKRTR